MRVFRGTQKWFGLLMSVSPQSLRISGDARIDILNVKCDPLLIGSLRLKPGFFPAYHMNKRHWITIRLDGSVSFGELEICYV